MFSENDRRLFDISMPNIDETIQWNHTYGDIGTDEAQAIIQTMDGGFVIVGWTGLFEMGDYNYWLVKTNAQGDLLWNQTYSGSGQDRAFSVIQTSDGGFTLVGITYSTIKEENNFGTNIWLVKTDKRGERMWDQMYGGVEDERVASVIQLTDGGFLIAGSTRSYGKGSWNAWLLKTNPITNYSLFSTDALSVTNQPVVTLPEFTITNEFKVFIVIGTILAIKSKRRRTQHPK